MIQFLKNVLVLVLWPNIWPILGNVPCVLEKNVYSAVVEWSDLYMAVRFSWLTVLFNPPTSLLSFCLDVLSIIESKVLISNYYFRTMYFFLQFCQCLLHIFGGCLVHICL